jgi:8-oxo-dGTP pyrophosphatase MutT (NUDIX family)
MRFEFAPHITDDERAAFLSSPKTARAARNAEACGGTWARVNAVHAWHGALGMAEFEVMDARRPDGGPAPGIVFLRGDAVAVLVVLRGPSADAWEDGTLYTVVTRQTRAAIGAPGFAEIPAGMMDGEGNFKSKALAELEEEVGADLGVRADDLVYLDTVYPSPGACDERLDLFYVDIAVSAETLRAIHGRQTGMAAEHESITCEVIPLDRLPEAAPTDMKARLAYASYAARMGFVPGEAPRRASVWIASVDEDAPTAHSSRGAAQRRLDAAARARSGLDAAAFAALWGDDGAGQRFFGSIGVAAAVREAALDPPAAPEAAVGPSGPSRP